LDFRLISGHEQLSINELLSYSDNCRRILRECLSTNQDAWNRPIEPPLIEFKTVRDIVVHTAGAEERWVKMRIGGQDVPFYADRAPAEIEGVFEDWDGFRKETNSFIGRQTPESLQKVFHLTLGGDYWTGDLTAKQILFHILNHETHHRGQISMALQQMGIDPPDFDFIFLHG
jgi:uncharacterized damage-inducible protein DinB